jgi:glycosyltransferase involved in cell wall biosynthesis
MTGDELKSFSQVSDATERFRVLLVASYCSRDDVGESWIAWKWAEGLSRIHDVTLVTQRRGGFASVAETLPQTRVVEFPAFTAFDRFVSFSRTLKPAYPVFYRRARRWIRDALARGERFDVAHQVIPNALRYPTPLHGFGIPYVMGPQGGSLATPEGFKSDFGREPTFMKLRVVDGLRFRLDPWLRRTYTDASLVLGVAPYVKDRLGTISLRDFDTESEVGIDQVEEVSKPSRRAGTGFRALFVGRFVRSKGARDVVRAIARVHDPHVTVDFVGEGYDLEECKAEAARLEVSHRCRFHGRLPRERVEEFYRDADAFVFPSFRESSGIVVLEAMRWGLPMIVATTGGPGFVVDANSGIRVEPRSPDQYASDIAAAIDRLVADPLLCRSLGAGAQRRVAEVGLWDLKFRRMTDRYREVMRRRNR